jgi:hypothetical protein
MQLWFHAITLLILARPCVIEKDLPAEASPLALEQRAHSVQIFELFEIIGGGRLDLSFDSEMKTSVGCARILYYRIVTLARTGLIL